MRKKYKKIVTLSSITTWDSKLDDFMRKVLHYLILDKLFNSMSIMSNTDTIQYIFDKALNRYKDSTNYPLIQIAVHGSSMTLGAGLFKNPLIKGKEVFIWEVKIII